MQLGKDITSKITSKVFQGDWTHLTRGRGSFNFYKTIMTLSVGLILGLYDEVSDWYYYMVADFGSQTRI